MNKLLLQKRKLGNLSKICLFILLSVGISYNTNAQCTNNTSQYPSGSITVNPDGLLTTINTCNYLSEFSIITGIVAGSDYEFTVTSSGYITIEQGGVVLNHGTTPVTATATDGTDIKVYWNVDASCATASSCETTTVQCVSCTPPPPPSNDACIDAISISSGQMMSGSTTTATNVENLTSCSGGTAGSDCAAGVNDGGIDFGAGVWYVYTSEATETITFEVTGFDTELQVFTGTCGSLTCVAGDDDSYSGGCCGSQVCFESTASFAPVDYYVYVDGHASNTGDFDFTVNTMVLPLDLVEWTGSSTKDGNKLSWTTMNEINTSHFSIEKLYEGNTWRSIGTVEANGISHEALHYSFIDSNPGDTDFYRLKSIDLDESYTYSDNISVSRTIHTEDVKVFPNPFSDELTVQLDLLSAQDISFSVHDITGKFISEKHIQAREGANNMNLNLEDQQAGIYVLSIQLNNTVIQKRIVKK